MPDSSQFGRYEVEEEVARGGMGVIYRVRDPEMRRFLAMKVLLSEPGETQGDRESQHSKLSSRFIDEAQLTGQLDHPGIIPVYDMGRDDKGRLFFTMRLVKGRTLEEIFDLVRDNREGWSVTRALGVLQKVSEAMAFAHEHGVIHRDLKPANIMVGRFGETYVMDWGLAKLFDKNQAASQASQQVAPAQPMQTIMSSSRKDESSRGGGLETMDGDVMGTPAYMAIEQARGEMHRVGPRSDVYALGAMLYHLLSGHAPYRPVGDTASGAEVLMRLYEGPPSAIDGEAKGQAPELCAICERAMAREPEDRYANMLDLSEDLHAYVENRVVQAYRQGALIEFKKWVQRNRAMAASLVALIVIVIAGLGSVSYVQTRARGEMQQKNLELKAERKLTLEARDEAERNQASALKNEELAKTSEQEALWLSYTGNIAAALAALEIGSASEARRRLAACSENLRGWEWRYLNQRADGSLRVLTGSKTFLGSLAVNPVKSEVAAAGMTFGDSGNPDYAIRIWDYESGELKRVIESHEVSITSLVYAPAGDVLLSADESGLLRFWDVESGELIAEKAGLGNRVDYHPNGRWVAVVDIARGNVVLWDSYDEAQLAKKTIPVRSNAIRFSPDGESLALAGADGHVRLLNLNLEVIREWKASDESLAEDRLQAPDGTLPGVSSIDFSPDGLRLATGSSDGFIRTWNVASGERLHFFRGHRSSVLDVRWHPRAPWIVSSDKSGAIRYWEADSGKALDVLRGHNANVTALRFSALGDRLLSASVDTTVRVWDGQSGVNDTFLDGLRSTSLIPYRLAFSPDGDRVVWRSAEMALSVTNVLTGEDLCSTWTPGPFAMAGLHFSNDDVWEVSLDGRVSRWNATTGERISALETGLEIRRVAFRPSDRAMAVGQADWSEAQELLSASVKLMDPTDGTLHWTTELPFSPQELRFSPDGSRLIVEGAVVDPNNSGYAYLDAESGKILWELHGLPRLRETSFFPEGDRFVHSTYNVWDNALFIRSSETGELLKTLTGQDQPLSVDISPDGSRIVTGNWNATMSLWSPERGEVLVLPAGSGWVPQVAFSPDGETIASLEASGARRLWSAAPVESRQAERKAAARRRRWSADARRRVDELLLTQLHPAAVVKALQGDRSLRPEQREAAILVARSDFSDPETLTRRSASAMGTGHSAAVYLRGLEAATLAMEWAPGMYQAHEVLGAIQARMELSVEALASLERAEELRAIDTVPVPPLVHFFKAFAHHQLGDLEASRREFKRGQAELRIGKQNWEPGVYEASHYFEGEVQSLLDSD